MRSTCLICKKIWTGVPGEPFADALIFSENGIAAVGVRHEMKRHPLFESSKKIWLEDRVVLPGLSDCHIHMQAYARQKTFVDLSKARSLSEMLALLAARAECTASDDWVCGFNMNEVAWGERSMPEGRDLDALNIPNPVLVQRICTHATTLNGRAMRLCRLDEAFSLEGVLLDASGAPSGVLVEEAQAIAHDRMGRDTFGRDRLLEQLRASLGECASYGLTALYVCGAASLGMAEQMDLYQTLRARGELPTRIFSYHDTDPIPSMTTGFGDRWIGYQGHKLFLDGSLGARTAALSEPYSDAPVERGMFLHTTDDLAVRLRHLEEIGCQVLVHTIGDAALDQLLDALEAAGCGRVEGRLPLLVNHCMICRPDQMTRMKKLGVAATIQPTFVSSDREMAPLRLGNRVEKGWAYPWRSLIDAGIRLNGSSDCPIESLNPWEAINAAVDREVGSGRGA